MSAPIQKLPNEILLAIFENFCGHCESSEVCICDAHDTMPFVIRQRMRLRKDLLNLAKTCRGFRPAALQVFYHAPSIDSYRLPRFPNPLRTMSPTGASHMLDFFRASLSFAPYVKKFVFRTTNGAPEGLEIPALGAQLAMFPNLEEATVQISFNDGVHLPAGAQLQRLRRASIMGSPGTVSLEGAWDLLERASGSLDLLTLQCIFVSAPALPCQNVTTLHLRGVEVEKPTLLSLFRGSFPRLQTLSWQNSTMTSSHNDDDDGDDRAPWGFFEAIAGLKDTLVHLDLIDGRLSFAEAAMWLPRMMALRTLSVPGRWSWSELVVADGTEETDPGKFEPSAPKLLSYDRKADTLHTAILEEMRPKWHDTLPTSLVVLRLPSALPHGGDFLAGDWEARLPALRLLVLGRNAHADAVAGHFVACFGEDQVSVLRECEPREQHRPPFVGLD